MCNSSKSTGSPKASAGSKGVAVVPLAVTSNISVLITVVVELTTVELVVIVV